MFKKNYIIFILFLILIFFPFFLSVNYSAEISFSRYPEIGGYYGTVPLSFILIYLFIILFFLKFTISKLEIFLLLFSLIFIMLSINFKNLVVLKNFLGISTFILSNIFFTFLFNFIRKHQLKDYFDSSFKFFFYLYFFLITYNVFILNFDIQRYVF